MKTRIASFIVLSLLLTGCYRQDFEKASAEVAQQKQKITELGSQVDGLNREKGEKDKEIARLTSASEEAKRELAAKREEVDRLNKTIVEKERTADRRKIKADLKAAIELQKELNRDASVTAIDASASSVMGEAIDDNPNVRAWRQKFQDYKPKILELTRISSAEPKIEVLANNIRELPDTTRELFDTTLKVSREAYVLGLRGEMAAAKKMLTEIFDKLVKLETRVDTLGKELSEMD